jgi:Cu(I)/Ag(I) efflux system membrane protein CusA/SilA
MPIKARIDMLSTGIRTPIGIKVFGKDLDEMEKLAREIEAVVKEVPGTTSAFAERITGGFYLNIEPTGATGPLRAGRRRRSGCDRQALGGEMVTTTVEGRERFGVTVRYPRELRSDPQQISPQVLVPTMDGAMIPLGQLAGRGRQGHAGHPHRECAAFGLYLRRHPRPRHRWLRGRCEEGGRRR